MKRSRRHKCLQVSVLFFIYSIIHIVAVGSDERTNVDGSKSDAKDATGGKIEETHNTNSASPQINLKADTKDADNDKNENGKKGQEKDGTDRTIEETHNTNSASQQASPKADTKNANKDKNENEKKEQVKDAMHNTNSASQQTSSKADTKDENKDKNENGKKGQGKHGTDSIIEETQNANSASQQSSPKADTKDENKDKTEIGKKEQVKDGTNATIKEMHNKNTASPSGTPKKTNNHITNKLTSGASTGSVHVSSPKNHTGIDTAFKPEGNQTEKCIPPAIKQFPHPIMSPETRKHGGLIIHILVAVYMFLGLAIVCDEYFVASLDRICEELKMSPDVAGATFMAAGSSAPELATVVIGVFFAKDDIGISGVIGSAVFNIMFVISGCALCSGTVVYLNWWPLVRDCFFYAVSILVMLAVIFDEKISWLESLVMLITYVIYCVVLHFNHALEKWAHTLPVPFKQTAPTEDTGLVSYKTLEEDGKHTTYGISPEKFPDPWNEDQGFESQLSGPALNQASIEQQPPPPPQPLQQDYYKPKEYNPENCVNPLQKPTDGGLYTQVSWAVIYPIHWLCRKSMPDCRSERYKNWYAYTFFMSMIWISFYSYFMVWMITIIGYTMGIPDTVMGLTFVAAGVSVPDALSSIAVIKEGYGDMAVSNAVGSNVFDILICLGLPWFIKTAIIKPGSTVNVFSKGLTYSTLSLLSTVVFLVVATHMNGWKLDKRYGVILMIWYLIFITFASMYELNVFGYLNPPECKTDW